METLRDSQKRKADSGMKDEKKIRQRSRGSEAVYYLRERMESDKQLRGKELDIRKKEVEIEAKKQENEDRRHKEFIQMMQLQNQQMQQMQVNYVQKYYTTRRGRGRKNDLYKPLSYYRSGTRSLGEEN